MVPESSEGGVWVAILRSDVGAPCAPFSSSTPPANAPAPGLRLGRRHHPDGDNDDLDETMDLLVRNRARVRHDAVRGNAVTTAEASCSETKGAGAPDARPLPHARPLSLTRAGSVVRISTVLGR